MNNTIETTTTDKLLEQIKQRFYDPYAHKNRFYQDRRMLLYTITWPAAWLQQRALPITPKHYHELLTQRIDDIAKHGDPERYIHYFPGYLLKTIQDWFAYHGDELYDELKHIRNHLHGIDTILRANSRQTPEDIVTPIAQAHAILAGQRGRKSKPASQRQLTLF